MTRGGESRLVNIARGAVADVYIGRGSPFGNPCIVGEPCPVCGRTHGDRDEVIACYRIYFKGRLEDPRFKILLDGLRGKSLGCFCTPKSCHGDVIIEYLSGPLDVGRTLDGMLGRLLADSD